ncbi:hypothetical protein CYMTET_5723 [Cymbomonas tetramitiformis]|uniref:Uncharacterized protein n=1 Tax=Cymbomonas tetramitiformis TaxID=36881 RepID=A0AAE0GYN0_9CHLO|nr:hypothetical protein CYMTET_5723 [Cymbomonas tetramitiformis]
MANCAPTSIRISFHLTAVMTNEYASFANGLDHLSADEVVLPFLHGGMCGVYLVAYVMWVRLVDAPRGSASRMKLVVAILISFKALLSLIQASRYHTFGVVGRHVVVDAYGSAEEHLPSLDREIEWSDNLEVSLRVLRGVLFFLITAVLAVGWLTLQPTYKQLRAAERVFLPALVPIQSFAYWLKLMLDEDVIAAPLFWQNVLHGVDGLCALVILVLVTRLMRREFLILGESMNFQQVMWYAYEEGILEQNLGTAYEMQRNKEIDQAIIVHNRLRQLRNVYLALVTSQFMPRLVSYLGASYLPLFMSYPNHFWLVAFGKEALVFGFDILIAKLAWAFISSPRNFETSLSEQPSKEPRAGTLGRYLHDTFR